MKRPLESGLPVFESSSGFNTPLYESSEDSSTDSNKRICSEEPSTSSSPFHTTSSESDNGDWPDPLRIESSVAIPRPILHVASLPTLPSISDMPAEIIIHLPELYGTVTIVFDFTLPLQGRKYFERWAGSLGNDLCDHIRRLKFRLPDDSDDAVFEGDGPLEACVAVVRGALCCSLENESLVEGGRQSVLPAREKMLDRKLAKVDDLISGSGFGVNGIVAIGRAMVC